MKKMDLSQIQIKDSLWKDKMQANGLFLANMDVDRVLAGFKRTCGIPTEADPYGGWEDSLIAGHGVGHFFSALAMEICSLSGELREGNTAVSSAYSEALAKAEAIVDGLLLCQKTAGSGFLSAATVQDPANPEIQFDSLEGKADAQNWVPWYALHKVLQGLIDLWVYADVNGAKEAAISLGDWVSDRVLPWDEAMKKKVLAVEYGGMNDSLYQLYALTGDEKYYASAEKFDEPSLYKDLLGFANRLRGVHANATIPKIIGYLQGAIVKRDDSDATARVEIAERFFDLVVKKQMYATGGIGDMEHFFLDGMLDASRTQCNAESCCCYNMMKLSQMLYVLTGKTTYLDYIDKTLWNAKLGSVGPDGGYTYFNPMGTGYYRLYSPVKPEENPFWCCVGTGLEDFAKVGDQICYLDEDTITVAQWISADVETEDGKKLSIRADFDKGQLLLSSNADISVRLRIPRWIKNRASLVSDGEEYVLYALQKDETRNLSFEMQLVMGALPDNKNAVYFTYGPFVLCVPLGNEKWGITEGAGIQVYAPAWKVVFDAAVKGDISYGHTQKSVLDREYLSLPSGETIESMKDHIEKYVQKNSEGKFFWKGMKNSKGEEVELPLVPYYGIGNERYGIYWYLTETV